MLTYSNQLKPLVLPEYGRNIQNMVDYCLTIEDRDRRTESAYAVVDAMLTLFPAKGDHEEHLRKLWDHVWIMSDYRLDVDYPYEHVNPEVFADRPDAVEPVRPGSMPYRHYGRLIPRLIDTAAAMEEGEERDALVFMIANQMKKTPRFGKRQCRGCACVLRFTQSLARCHKPRHRNGEAQRI